MRPFAVILPLLLAAVSSTASAAHVMADIVADRTAVAPGATITLAITFKIEPGWHLYWTNPGDTGLPPKVKWTLPAGVTAGPLRFPTPQRIDADGAPAFGYHDSLTLLADLTAPPDAKDTIEVQAAVNWVVCADACVAERQKVSLSIPVGRGRSQAADLFTAWRAEQPERPADAKPLTVTVAADKKHGTIDLPVPPGKTGVDFFPPKADFVVYDKPTIVGNHFRTAFRILPDPPAESVGTGVVVWKDEKTGKTSSVEYPVAYRFVTPSSQE